jgi:hypothetical protein
MVDAELVWVAIRDEREMWALMFCGEWDKRCAITTDKRLIKK